MAVVKPTPLEWPRVGDLFDDADSFFRNVEAIRQTDANREDYTLDKRLIETRGHRPGEPPIVSVRLLLLAYTC